MGGVNKHIWFQKAHAVKFVVLTTHFLGEILAKYEIHKFTNQHVAIFNVEVQEEEEGDEEAEEGNGGAFPQTPHLVQGFPHQPHAVQAVAGICKRRT